MPKVFEEKCGGCGICVVSCPEEAIKMWGFPEINKGQCIECSICIENCPCSAIMAES